MFRDMGSLGEGCLTSLFIWAILFIFALILIFA